MKKSPLSRRRFFTGTGAVLGTLTLPRLASAAEPAAPAAAAAGAGVPAGAAPRVQPPVPAQRTLSQVERYRRGLRVHVSHFGYHPDHPKDIVCDGALGARTFAIHDAATQAVVFSGALTLRTDDDFGAVLVGDFTALSRAGEYYAVVGDERSFGTFRIAEGLWGELQRLTALEYFGLRRIGEDSVIGYRGDFHGVRWEDAIDPTTGTWRYVGRAWADGDDDRVFPSCSLVVAQYCLLARTRPWWDTGDWIYQQVRWGLDGALSFLDHDGLLRQMLYSHPERETDGEFCTGDEKRLGDAFDPSVTINEYGRASREHVRTMLLIGLAEAALLYRERDRGFFDRVVRLCLIGAAALERSARSFQERGYVAPGETFDPMATRFSVAARAWLSSLLHALTGEAAQLDRAIASADQLLALQQREPLGDATAKLSGWFRADAAHDASPWGEKPEQEVMIVPWLYQALFRLVELQPGHARAPQWREAIRRYASDYLAAGARLNAFHYTPMKVGSRGLKRERGTLSYQYFGQIGRMFHQIGNAAFLLQAGRLLRDAALEAAAWRQMQWFAGVNPLGVGLVYGLSANVPPAQYYRDTWGRAFPGGTVNGMTGDARDQPELRFFEFYTYANLNLLWFSTVAGSDRFSAPFLLWPREVTERPHVTETPLVRFPVRVKSGFRYRFTALARGRSAGDTVRWSVNGIAGGNADVGTISPDGLYAAPRVTASRSVTLRAESGDDRTQADETPLLILPAPADVTNLSARRRGASVRLTWERVDEHCSGYTIWRRMPHEKIVSGRASIVQVETIGTIFERLWAVPADVTSYDTSHYCPPGTEFLVRAYHRTETALHGYGPESAIVSV